MSRGGVELLRIISAGALITGGANAAAAGPPHVTRVQDSVLLLLGSAMIIMAVQIIVRLAREGRE